MLPSLSASVRLLDNSPSLTQHLPRPLQRARLDAALALAQRDLLLELVRRVLDARAQAREDGLRLGHDCFLYFFGHQ